MPDERDKIAVTVDGRVHEFAARHLTKEEWDGYMELLNKIARRRYNPFKDFSAKVAVLPENLQAVALREFMQSDEYLEHETQPSEILEAMGTPEGINYLSELVTDERLVTEKTFDQLWPQLMHFLEPVD